MTVSMDDSYAVMGDTKDIVKCPYCREVYVNPVNLPCGHVHCRSCADIVHAVDGKCTVCSINFSPSDYSECM